MLEKLVQIQDAPQEGHVLAYTRKQVYFEKYSSLDQVEVLLGKEEAPELLELHLFDGEKEYRMVTTNGHRAFPNSAEGTIECIVEQDADEEHTYEEAMYLDSQFKKIGKKIKVVNHIVYDDENGMAVVDTYRLSMEV